MAVDTPSPLTQVNLASSTRLAPLGIAPATPAPAPVAVVPDPAAPAHPLKAPGKEKEGNVDKSASVMDTSGALSEPESPKTLGDDGTSVLDRTMDTLPTEVSEAHPEPAVREHHTTGKPEVTIADLVKYLTKDVNSTRQNKTACMYFLFLLCITLLLILERLILEEETFFRDVSMRTALQAVKYDFMESDPELETDFLDNVEDLDSFWKWTKSAVQNIWPEGTLTNAMKDPKDGMTWTGPNNVPQDTERVNIPLGFILLRQFRVDTEKDCPTGLNTPSDAAAATPAPAPAAAKTTGPTCFPPFNSDTVSTASRTPTPPTLPAEDLAVFLSSFDCNNSPNKKKGSFVNSIPREGEATVFSQPSKAFSVLLFTHNDLPSVENILTELEKSNWVDEATRGIFLEAITYNQADSKYVFTSALVEKLATNAYIPSIQSIPFKFLAQWSWTEQVTLGLDAFIFIFVIVDFLEFVLRQKMDRDIHQAASTGLCGGVSPWAFFRMAMAGIYFITAYFRGMLWYLSLQIGENYYYDNYDEIMHDYASDATTASQDRAEMLWMWYKMAQYAYLYRQWSISVSATVVLCYLRVFSFLQYYELANILTETIKLAVAELVGVIFLGSIVIVGYAITANLLYGSDIEDFKHFMQSLYTLLRSMVSGEVEQLPEMVRVYKWESRFVVLTYQMLVWLVLLNMILAIISGAFVQVQEGMNTSSGDYSPMHTLKAWFAVKFSFLIPATNSTEVDVSDEPAVTRAATDSRTSAASTSRQDMSLAPVQAPQRSTDYVSTRILAVQQLRSAFESGKFKKDGADKALEVYDEKKAAEEIVTQDMFIEVVCRQGAVPLTVKEVQWIFDRAGQEVSANNRSINKGDKWAQGFTTSLKKLQEEGEYIGSALRSAYQLPASIESQGELGKGTDKAAEQMKEMEEVIARLHESLKKASEATALEALQNAILSLEEEVDASKVILAKDQLQQQKLKLDPTITALKKMITLSMKQVTAEVRSGTLAGKSEAPPEVFPVTEEFVRSPTTVADKNALPGLPSLVMAAEKFRYPEAGDATEAKVQFALNTSKPSRKRERKGKGKEKAKEEKKEGE